MGLTPRESYSFIVFLFSITFHYFLRVIYTVAKSKLKAFGRWTMTNDYAGQSSKCWGSTILLHLDSQGDFDLLFPLVMTCFFFFLFLFFLLQNQAMKTLKTLVHYSRAGEKKKQPLKPYPKSLTKSILSTTNTSPIS